MKRRIGQYLPIAVVMTTALILTGCYTEMGTTENEEIPAQAWGETYDDTTTVSDSTIAQQYNDGRREFYFDYYYPSFAFSIGYYSPWYWGPTWWYSPYWTPYWYGYAWYAPVSYPGWYYPYYGYPGYPAYPGYPGGYGHPYATRSFGNTRTIGTTRGRYTTNTAGASMLDASRGTTRSGATSPGARSTSGVRPPTVPRTLPRATVPRVNQGSRPAGRTSTSGRGYEPGGRSGTTRENPGSRVVSPSGGSRGEATRSGGGRSYSPPSSAPPSSPGGGGGGGGRSGGGGRRGGR